MNAQDFLRIQRKFVAQETNPDVIEKLISDLSQQMLGQMLDMIGLEKYTESVYRVLLSIVESALRTLGVLKGTEEAKLLFKRVSEAISEEVFYV